jgi:hypothetical protein
MLQQFGRQAAGNNNNNNPPVTITQIDGCISVMKQGIANYCENFETYDAAKCAYVSREDVSLFLFAYDGTIGRALRQ